VGGNYLILMLKKSRDLIQKNNSNKNIYHIHNAKTSNYKDDAGLWHTLKVK